MRNLLFFIHDATKFVVLCGLFYAVVLLAAGLGG